MRWVFVRHSAVEASSGRCLFVRCLERESSGHYVLRKRKLLMAKIHVPDRAQCCSSSTFTPSCCICRAHTTLQAGDPADQGNSRLTTSQPLVDQYYFTTPPFNRRQLALQLEGPPIKTAAAYDRDSSMPRNTLPSPWRHPLQQCRLHR